VKRDALSLCVAVLVAGCFNPDDSTADTDATSADASTDGTGGTTDPSGSSDATASTTAPTTGDTEDPSDPSAGSSESGGVACDVDADCDDGLACNGVELCAEGTCRNGTPFCDNPDADNCDVQCEEGDPPTCTVVAADADRDGDGSIACKAAPGTDCNDDDDRIFGDAEEVCDGVDNDCNGLADTADGLPLFDQPSVTPGAFFADLAFDPESLTYGIAYNGQTGDFFTAYDLDQTQVATPTVFPNSDNPGRVFLEWSGETFAGVYENNDFMLRRSVNADGLMGNELTVFTSGGVGLSYAANELAGGGVAVAWERGPNELALRLLGPDLDPAGNAVFFDFASPPRTPRVARVENTFAIAVNTGTTNLGFYDADLAEQTTVQVTANPTGTIYGTFDVVPMGDGFAVAYETGTASNRIEYVEYELDGSVRCGPVQISDPGPVNYNAMDAHDGVAAIYASEGDDWILRRMAEGCVEVGDGVTIETIPFFGEVGDVDINETGIGIVTQIFDDGGANPRMVFRALGPSLCGPPIMPE
jgi:hypothetical protein